MHTGYTRRGAARCDAMRCVHICKHTMCHTPRYMHARRTPVCPYVLCVPCSPVARLSKYNPTTVYTHIRDVFNGYRDFRYSPDKVGKYFVTPLQLTLHRIRVMRVPWNQECRNQFSASAPFIRAISQELAYISLFFFLCKNMVYNKVCSEENFFFLQRIL